MPAKMVTFRSELKSTIADFLGDAGMTCSVTEESLVALTVKLADHREEGKQLFPKVLICDDRDTVLRNIQGTDAILIGTGERIPDTVLRALKKCAPLADNGWAIWINREPNNFSYGVFREPSNPTSLDLRRTLLDTQDEGQLAALLIAQFAPGKVELISAGKPGLRVHLTGERADAVSDDPEGDLVIMWSECVAEDSRESFASFATTLIHDLLRKGHGTLLAITPDGASLDFLADAVVLETPIDLAGLVRNHGDNETSAALSELNGYANLLEGMMNSDGIVVVDSAGRVLAFNWFIKTDTTQLTPREQQGGARHRAFGALKALVDDKTLRGAFIRSADGGETAYTGSDHD